MLCFVTFEMFGLFFNTSTADDKYSRHNIKNLRTSSNAIILKTKNFCQFLVAFRKSTSNSEYSEKKKKR